MPRLTAKQARFVEEYLVDLNATQAAIRAGYSQRRADSIGYENLRKPEIRDAIQAEQLARSAKTGITAARVVQEIARIAFADPRLVAKWDQSGIDLCDSATLTDDAAAAISEIKQGQFGVTVKLHSKVAALEQLAKHVGLYAERTPDDESLPRVIVYIPGNDR